MDFTALNILGYQIIRGVLSEAEVEQANEMFTRWHHQNRVGDAPHGVIKHYKAGQSAFSWFIRTRPRVRQVFEELYHTKDLVVSFDGQGYFPRGQKKRNSWWLHTDQAPSKIGRVCVQGLVSLTTNNDCGLAVVEGTHEKHHSYFSSRGISHNKDWARIEEDASLERRLVILKKGDLVIWDSRLFHQNLYSPSGERRLVQYVSYLPRSGLSPSQAKKRATYFETERTTSHWAYPVRVNSLQPQVFGDRGRLINYDDIVDPDSSWKFANIEAINKLV